MKKTIFWVMAALMVSLASCSKDDTSISSDVPWDQYKELKVKAPDNAGNSATYSLEEFLKAFYSKCHIVNITTERDGQKEYFKIELNHDGEHKTVYFDISSSYTWAETHWRVSSEKLPDAARASLVGSFPGLNFKVQVMVEYHDTPTGGYFYVEVSLGTSVKFTVTFDLNGHQVNVNVVGHKR